MKIILVFLSISVLSLTASAGEGGKKPSLDERKAKVSSHIDRRISSLNDFKSCVNKASEGEQIKACREKHQAEMKKMRAENPGRKRGKGRHRSKNN